MSKAIIICEVFYPNGESTVVDCYLFNQFGERFEFKSWINSTIRLGSLALVFDMLMIRDTELPTT